MTAAVVAFAIFAYPAVAAAVLSRSLRRVDVEFVRDMHRVLRSRTPGGSGSAGSLPLALPAPAGGDARTPRPVAAALPPAPRPLVGAALIPSSAAPARPPRVTVHG